VNDPALPPEIASLVKQYSPFVKEVRKRIFLTLGVFAVSTLAGFFFYENIIRFLVGALSIEGVNVVFTSPFQFINLAISCGVVTGLVVALPVFIAQVLLFLKPALSGREYRLITRLLPFSIVLFFIGFVFGAVIMRWQFQIFLERSIAMGIGNILDINRLLTTVLLTSLLMGIGFQFPIILLILIRFEIIKYRDLSRKRLWVYLGALLFTVLLPLDSILADFLLAVPLVALFEITLLLSRVIQRRKPAGAEAKH